MAWEYSEKTTKLFLDAVAGKPGTHLGEIKNPDGIGEHGSIACGDALRFTFRVKRDPKDPLKDIITETKYLTFGCTSAIASSEALCIIIEKGRYSPIKAMNISNDDIIDYLDGLPNQKIHCSVMGAEALQAAIFNWAKNRDVDLKKLGIDMRPEEKEDGKLICECFSLTEPYIRRKIKELGLKTIPDITASIKAGGACGKCHYSEGGLQDLLDDEWGKQKVREFSGEIYNQEKNNGKSGMSTYQRNKMIENTIDRHIRPILDSDGGDFEIIDIKDDIVYGRLKGSCAICVSAQGTLKEVVEKILKEKVDEKIKVISV